MSYARRRFLPSRPFRVRIILPPRPYYGGRRVFRPASLASTGASILGGALGVLGGTLGCLLCLSAIAALGLFSCTVAITAYAKKFLDAYKTVENINSGVEQLHIGMVILLVSLFYIIICHMQRN